MAEWLKAQLPQVSSNRRAVDRMASLLLVDRVLPPQGPWGPSLEALQTHSAYCKATASSFR